MFSECSSLKELNLSNLNTDNITDMFYMFNGCSSLKELNLNNFNTNNVTNMIKNKSMHTGIIMHTNTYRKITYIFMLTLYAAYIIF